MAAPYPASLDQVTSLLPLAARADATIEHGLLLVADDGKIAALGVCDGTTSPQVIAARRAVAFATVDLGEKIIMSDFVSSHSHLGQSACRGLTPTAELPAWLDALHRTYGGPFA